jgi:hypothetical protein
MSHATNSAAEARLEERDRSFDLALSVMRYCRAIQERPAATASDALQMYYAEMRDRASSMVTDIAREGVRESARRVNGAEASQLRCDAG